MHLGSAGLAHEQGPYAGHDIIEELYISLVFGPGAREAEAPWTDELHASIGWPFDVDSTGLRRSLAEDSEPW